MVDDNEIDPDTMAKGYMIDRHIDVCIDLDKLRESDPGSVLQWVRENIGPETDLRNSVTKQVYQNTHLEWKDNIKLNNTGKDLKPIRLEVLEFAIEMERTLSLHDNDKGDTWKNNNDIDFIYLYNKLLEELMEYMLSKNIDRYNIFDYSIDIINKFIRDKTSGIDSNCSAQHEPRKELIDIANIAMMLYTRDDK